MYSEGATEIKSPYVLVCVRAAAVFPGACVRVSSYGTWCGGVRAPRQTSWQRVVLGLV